MLVTKEGNTVKISAYQNEEYTDRNVSFTIKAGTGEKLVSETIDVLQDRAAHIASSVLTVPVTPFSDDAREVEIQANFDWEYLVSGNDDRMAEGRKDDKGSNSPLPPTRTPKPEQPKSQ